MVKSFYKLKLIQYTSDIVYKKRRTIKFRMLLFQFLGGGAYKKQLVIMGNTVFFVSL